MVDSGVATLATELSTEAASQDIARAVSGRRSVARRYVMWARRRNPEATPDVLIQHMGRHYISSITAAGALITAGTIAVDVGIALIPVAGAAAAGVKSAGAQAAKQAGKEVARAAAKEATKQAAKQMALGAAKSGAQRIATMLPAGDEQLQFEITALYALAIAEIHGMNLDDDQAQALVYGLSNGRVGAQMIAEMAADVASSEAGIEQVGRNISAGQNDWGHWANTLADSLPSGGAQTLVRTIQTGELENVRTNLSGKQQAAVKYGVAAVAGGVTRFVFGRDVVEATRTAFAEAPQTFPPHLALKERGSDDGGAEPNRALAALEEAAKNTSGWITETATNVGAGVAAGASVAGAGVANVAGTVSRPFRSVDLDGDGIPDEAQAVTAVKNAASVVGNVATVAGRATTGVATNAAGAVTGWLKRGKARGEES